jgi:hypothetical protein
VNPALLYGAALALVPWAGAGAASERCAHISGPQAPDDPALRRWLRALVHEVARQESVNPHALEALGMTETSLRPSIGRACEVGPFQVMPFWAGIFRLDPPSLLWDPRINAIAAARIYRSGWLRWNARFAQAGKGPSLRAAGWRGPLDRETFAAIAYNWGKAPLAFAQASDLRAVPIPASTIAYAVRFSALLREARARADSGTPRGRRP